ncbi:transferase, partial [Streptomyces sp. NPDC054756]
VSTSGPRADVANWRARVAASRPPHEILLGSGQKELARAARAKFLDHELRMYARELELRDAAYRRDWWAHTRAYLAEYDASDWAHNPTAPGRLIGRIVLASPEPADLPRLRDLASRPARLLPPYARAADGTPVWSAGLPQVTLEPLLTRPVHVLPLAVDADLRPGPRTAVLRLRLHELYGRVARAGPEALEVEWRCRETGRAAGPPTPVRPEPDGENWRAACPVRWAAFGAGTWDLRLRLRFREGAGREVTAHAVTGTGGLRRRAVLGAGHTVVLVQPYTTHSGALAVRVAPGLRGVLSVVRGRLRRLLH